MSDVAVKRFGKLHLRQRLAAAEIEFSESLRTCEVAAACKVLLQLFNFLLEVDLVEESSRKLMSLSLNRSAACGMLTKEVQLGSIV